MYVTLTNAEGFPIYINCEDIRVIESDKITFRNGDTLDFEEGVTEQIAAALFVSTDFVKIEREKVSNDGNQAQSRNERASKWFSTHSQHGGG